MQGFHCGGNNGIYRFLLYNSVIIPLDRAQKFYDRGDTVSFILAVPEPGTDAEDLSKRLELYCENDIFHQIALNNLIGLLHQYQARERQE